MGNAEYMGVTTSLHLKMEMKILQTIIVGILSFKTVVAGPQYGGGQQSQVSVPAPAPVVTQSCWMEQETIWDTQYVDQVTMECNEIVKQVPQRVSKSVPKQVCDDEAATEPNPVRFKARAAMEEALPRVRQEVAVDMVEVPVKEALLVLETREMVEQNLELDLLQMLSILENKSPRSPSE